MLIDLGFLGLQMNLSDSTFDHTVVSRVVSSDFKINFIGERNFASVAFTYPIEYTHCTITDINQSFSDAVSNPHSEIFAQKIFVVEKMIREGMSKDDILEHYPELVI